jgi:hypothetical protein
MASCLVPLVGVSGRTPEEEIGRQADGAFGVVRRGPLLRAGITSKQIEHRLRIGVLLQEYPGIYRVGHRAPSVEASYLAAVWACGEQALLSGRAAAYHLGFLRGKPPPPEVTAPTWRRVKGLKTKQCRGLQRRDGTIYRGIPVTTVAVTIVDLAAELSEEELARLCHEAGVKHKTTPAQRRPRSRGAATSRALRNSEPCSTAKSQSP